MLQLRAVRRRLLMGVMLLMLGCVREMERLNGGGPTYERQDLGVIGVVNYWCVGHR